MDRPQALRRCNSALLKMIPPLQRGTCRVVNPVPGLRGMVVNRDNRARLRVGPEDEHRTERKLR